MKTSLVVADAHPLVMEGIAMSLEASEAFDVMARTDNGTEVLPLVEEHRPELVLLDVHLPSMDGFACLEQIRSRFSETVVVMLSADERRDLVGRALARGAAGYIVKTIEVADLPAVLRQIVSGTIFTAIAAHDDGHGNGNGFHPHGLTPREQEILGLVARGLTNKAIGKELWVTDQTVKFHLTNVYRKLEVGNRTAAVQAAYRLGLV